MDTKLRLINTQLTDDGNVEMEFQIASCENQSMIGQSIFMQFKPDNVVWPAGWRQ